MNPFGGKYTSFTQYTDQGDVTGWSRGEQRQRQFGVSISYRFGSLRTSVKKADKTIENDDLIGGGRQSGNTGTGNGAVGAGGMGN